VEKYLPKVARKKKGESDEDKEESKTIEETKEEDQKGSKKAEEEWVSDSSKEAQKKRKEQEFQSLASADSTKLVEEILSSAKADNKSESPVTILKVFIAGREHTVDEIIGELKRLQLSRGLDDSQRVKILLEALIDTSNPASVAGQFKKHAPIFKKLANDKNTGNVLLACIEELAGVIEKKLLPRVPVILQTLYESEVLDETTLLTWHATPPEASWLVNKKVAAQVRVKAKPFIDWLKDAEEE